MDNKYSDEKEPEKQNPESAEENEVPPSVLRRRKENRYYSNPNSGMYNKVLIIAAFLIAVFMIRTRNCENVSKNMAHVFKDGKKTNDSTTVDGSETGK
jgi:hypothetical protein